LGRRQVGAVATDVDTRIALPPAVRLCLVAATDTGRIAMLLAMLLTLAAQDAPAQPARDPDGTRRWSILVDPCASSGNGNGNEIVVCGQGAAAASPRLPLPDERGPPDRPMPGNPDVSGIGALDMASAPCAARMGGCTTGLDLFGGGTFLVRAVGKLIDPDSCCEAPGEATNPIALARDMGSVVKRAFRKKPDKSNRVPIPLDDPAPAEAAQPAGVSKP
jgi:hypothetical protein